MENYSPDAYGDPDDKEVEVAQAEVASPAQPKAKSALQAKSKRKIFVRDIAAQCNVEEATVTKWIRNNAIPAQKAGKKWFVRECDLNIFITNGCKMPEDYLPIENPSELDLGPDPVDLDAEKPGGMRPIMPFVAYESSRTGWTPIRGTKFPSEWAPRIARIVEKVPHYHESTGCFIRDAVFARLQDLESVLVEMGEAPDEKWKLYVASQTVIQERMSYERCIEALKKAVAALRSQKNKSEWEKFYSENIGLVCSMPQPWKKKALAILNNRQKEVGDI